MIVVKGEAYSVNTYPGRATLSPCLGVARGTMRMHSLDGVCKTYRTLTYLKDIEKTYLLYYTIGMNLCRGLHKSSVLLQELLARFRTHEPKQT